MSFHDNIFYWNLCKLILSNINQSSFLFSKGCTCISSKCLEEACNFSKNRGFGANIFLWILWNFKNTYFYRAPLVAASESNIFKTRDQENNSLWARNVFSGCFVVNVKGNVSCRFGYLLWGSDSLVIGPPSTWTFFQIHLNQQNKRN